VTDVKDLHDWMVKHLSEHPLFEAVSEQELAEDVVAQKIMDCTEEGQKVTRNKGDKFIKIFRRTPAGVKPWSLDPHPEEVESDDERDDGEAE